MVWKNESSGELKKSGQVTFNAAGLAVLSFYPDHGNQRWEVDTIVVSTNQPASASIVPVVTLAENTLQLSQMSAGNQRGSSWNGNFTTFQTGKITIGPGDFLSVMWSPPAGVSGAPLAGVIGSAVVSGTKYNKTGG